MRNRGLTLIEMLAVVTILGMAAAIVATAASSGGEGETARGALASFASLDAKARLFARTSPSRQTESCMRLIVSDQGTALIAVDNDGAVIGRVAAPIGTTWALESAGGHSVEAVPIARSGRSIDYSAILRSKDGQEEEVELLGLTGTPRMRKEHAP